MGLLGGDILKEGRIQVAFVEVVVLVELRQSVSADFLLHVGQRVYCHLV